MTPETRQQSEYEALRATIRERGTARMVLAPVVFIGWAAVAVATASVITVALSTLVPLMVLAAGFEGIFALHANVERIGRYLQVFHEQADQGGGGWEHVAMAFGRQARSGGPDPLFGRLFAVAVSINYLPAALGGTPIELGLLAVLHLVVLYRVRTARSWAAGQRESDLQAFAALRAGETPSPQR